MTEIQFFNQLKKLNLESVFNGWIREPLHHMCPIIAVANAKGLVKSHPFGDTPDADNQYYTCYAKKMGLDPQLAKELASAADNDSETTLKRKRCDLKNVKRLRAKLVKLCKN